MKWTMSFVFASLVLASAGVASASLIVTGVFDGPLTGGEPKVVELFVKADIADLSLYGVGAANNLGGTDGIENTLSGSASMGDFIYIVDDNANGALGVGFANYFGFTPALLFNSNAGINGGAAAINGDDAIEVFFNGNVIDTFGNISGPLAGWNYLDGWAYRNDNTGPDGTTFVASNWTFSGINATDGQTNNNGASVFPIGTYSMIPEPATFAMLLMGLSAVGACSMRARLG